MLCRDILVWAHRFSWGSKYLICKATELSKWDIRCNTVTCELWIQKSVAKGEKTPANSVKVKKMPGIFLRLSPPPPSWLGAPCPSQEYGVALNRCRNGCFYHFLSFILSFLSFILMKCIYQDRSKMSARMPFAYLFERFSNLPAYCNYKWFSMACAIGFSKKEESFSLQWAAELNFSHAHTRVQHLIWIFMGQ